jgi:hypothetical protein
MNSSKKELIKAYKQTPPAMGIYQVRNLVNDKVFIGSSLNLPGILNRTRLQLSAGNYLNKQLQAEWQEFGSDKFAFEVLDKLAATENAGYDYRPDLAVLLEMWLERLAPYGERGYNAKQLGPEEKLRQIAQKRLANN